MSTMSVFRDLKLLTHICELRVERGKKVKMQPHGDVYVTLEGRNLVKEKKEMYWYHYDDSLIRISSDILGSFDLVHS